MPHKDAFKFKVAAERHEAVLIRSGPPRSAVVPCHFSWNRLTLSMGAHSPSVLKFWPCSQDLDTVDSMLELTSKYQLSELQQSLFDELLESARLSKLFPNPIGKSVEDRYRKCPCPWTILSQLPCLLSWAKRAQELGNNAHTRSKLDNLTSFIEAKLKLAASASKLTGAGYSLWTSHSSA
ncbi:hypothetical protein WJX84_000314 [Apatococcus fuscideae]|uniref:Uncharacterized protein n=1 Tax=Apatococcus fuscideae TaxID=2026836 RepID=A0AAW1TEU0_9CHLO